MAGIPLALNFDLGAPLPLDSRIVIAQFSQLNNINPKYSGMQVYASDTKKLYYLEDLSSNKWTEVITNSNLPSLPTSLVYTTGNQTISGTKLFSSGNGGYLKSELIYTNSPDNLRLSDDPGNITSLPLNFSYLNSTSPFETTSANANTTGYRIFWNFTNNNKQELSRHIRTQMATFQTGLHPLFGPWVTVAQNVQNSTGIIITGFPNVNASPKVLFSNYPLEDRLAHIEKNGVFSLLPEERMGIGVHNPSEKLHIVGNLRLDGVLQSSLRPIVNGTGVLLQGEIPSLPNTLVYTTGDQLISGRKTFLDNSVFNKNIDAFEKISLTNRNWSLTNTFFGTVLTGSVSSGQFIGEQLYLNNDGNILITYGSSNYNDNWSYGTYIFTTGINNTWKLLQEIVTTVSGYGRAFKMSRDNSVLVIGNPNDFLTSNGIVYRPGEVHVYTGSIQNGWIKKQTLTGIIENYEEFGSSIAISDNAEVIAVGSPKSAFVGNGRISIFTGSKNTDWKLKQIITGETVLGSLGSSLACNYDASLILAGSYDRTSYGGFACTFVGSPTTNWTLQQKFSGVFENGDYYFPGYARFGVGVDINNSGNILMITDPNKLNARGCVYFYTGSKNNTWVNTSQVFGLYPGSFIKGIKCNNDASIVLAEASWRPFGNGDDGHALVLQKSTDFSWFIKQQITEPSGVYDLFGEGITINGNGDTFAIGTRVTSNFSANLFEKGAINVYKDLTPNEFSVGNIFPESFVKIIGSTNFVGDTIISGNTKIYSNDRPSINNIPIVLSGEAIMPDSDARLYGLEFKNISTFALEGPYFRSSYQGSGNPAGLTLWGSEGRIANFTETGVRFFERPTVKGTGVLLSGEAARLPETIVYTTGNQTISGVKTFINAARVDSVNFTRNFKATGAPYNYTASSTFGSDIYGLTGILYNGWNLATINPSDDNLSIKLSSGSLITIIIDGSTVQGSAVIGWRAVQNKFDLSQQIPFDLFSGDTAFQSITNLQGPDNGFGTVQILSGYLPKEYDRLVIRYLGGGGNRAYVAVSGNFGIHNEIKLETRNNRLFLGNSGVLLQGEAYPSNNPSGFLTGVDLSSYATISNLATTGSTLTTQINNLSGVSVLTYGNQTIGGIKTFSSVPVFNNGADLNNKTMVRAVPSVVSTATAPALTDADHNGRVIYMTNATAVTITIPAGLSPGFNCTIIQGGGGSVTIANGAGVTLNSYLSSKILAGIYAAVSIVSVTQNNYIMYGNTL